MGAGAVCQAIPTALAEDYEDIQEFDEEGGIAAFWPSLRKPWLGGKMPGLKAGIRGTRHCGRSYGRRGCEGSNTEKLLLIIIDNGTSCMA